MGRTGAGIMAPVPQLWQNQQKISGTGIIVMLPVPTLWQNKLKISGTGTVVMAPVPQLWHRYRHLGSGTMFPPQCLSGHLVSIFEGP